MASDGTLKFDTLIDSSGFQKGIDTIGSIASKGLKATGAILTGAATAIGTIGAAAIKVGSDFESAMSKVEAISGATGDDLTALTEKAKQMGATTKFSATESANAMEYMAMAGWKTEDMLNGIEGIMNLAAASGEDLATTSDIVTDALTAFGLSAKDSTHFADVLAAASSNANTNVGMMGETFKYVAPVAGALGFSAEDTAVAIGLMANSGIKASQAGTSLRAIMSRMAKPTDEVQAAMDALGVSITNSDGSMKSLSAIMGDLRTGFAGLSEAEKAQMAASLGGQEAMSGLLAIVNASDADFDKLSESIYSCDGAAADMAETMNDNLQGQLTILKSGLEGLGISLYENMQEPLKEVAKDAQGMVQELQTAFDEGGLEGMVSAVGNVLAEIVQKVAEFAPTLIESATGLVTSFCTGLTSANGITEAGAGLITSLVTALFECSGQIWSTAITLVGQLASGIAAGAPQMVQSASDCITTIINTFIAYLPTVIDAGVQIIQAIITGIANMLPTLMTQAVTLITTIATKIVENIPTLIDCAIQIVQALIDGLIQSMPLLLEGAVQLFQAIVDAIPVIIEKLLAALPGIITSIVDFLVTSLPQIVDAAVQMLNGIIEAIPTIIQAIVDNLPQIITALVDGLVNALPQILQAAITLLMAIIEAIPDIVVAIAENLPQIITAIATGLGDAIPKIFTAAKDLLWQIVTAIPDIVVGIGEAVPDIIAGIVNGLKNGISSVFDAAKELCKGLLNGIKEFFGIHSPSTVMEDQGDYLVQGMINGLSSLPDKAREALSNTTQAILEWGQNILQSATDTATQAVTAVITAFSEMPGKLWTWLTDVITKAIQWGINLKTTFDTWVQNTITSVVTFFSQLPGKIWTWLVETVNKAIQWGINLKNTADTYVQNTINSVVNFFSQLPGKIWTWLVSVITKVTQWGANLLSTATTAATNAINSVVNWFSQLPGKVWTWLVNVVTKVTQWAANLLSAASSAAQNAINKVVEWFQQLPGKVWTWLTNTITKVTQFATNLAAKASSAAQGFVTNIVNGLKGLPDKMAEIGSNIVSGIWNGISAGWTWLTDKVKNLASSLFEAAKDALDINSPSRKFADEVGRWIPPGIGVGIDETMPDLQDQVGDEMDALAQKMQAAVDVETGDVTVRTKAKAQHEAETEYPKGGDTYIDQHMEQENNYHVPVATPSEVSKANREAARKLLGGVK